MSDFLKPILIVGAPRSGTSLLQKVLRNHPSVWSLPSESDFIWDRYCHPSFHNWESEVLTADDCDEAVARRILRDFRRYACPASVWSGVERTNLIWGFRRWRLIRKLLRVAYSVSTPIATLMYRTRSNIRLVEKTASNCFRLGFVNQVFPDAKIIYAIRDGRMAISSMLSCWEHPTRFFTYKVPERLEIPDYEHNEWKFVLPPAWRDYVSSPLEEICAFQWRQCNEHMLAETSRPEYAGRVMRVRLEDLSSSPEEWLPRIAEFAELPYDEYFQRVAADLPVINSPDNDTSPDKWKRRNGDRIERILPRIEAMLHQLGYSCGEVLCEN